MSALETSDACGDCSDLNPDNQYYYDGPNQRAAFLADCVEQNISYCTFCAAEAVVPLVGIETAAACPFALCPATVVEVCEDIGYQTVDPCVPC